MIINPMGKSNVKQYSLAPRKGTLEGATVGLLDSSKRNSDLLLEELGAILMERYGVKQVVMRRKPHFSVPAPTELVDEMAAQCDAVIPAVGD